MVTSQKAGKVEFMVTMFAAGSQVASTMNILIVEDEAKTAAYLRKGLIENGFGVDLAATGQDGLHLIYGQAMIDELARHGYRLSAGTLYPILRGGERKDYLVSAPMREGRSGRRCYRITPLGRRALRTAQRKVDALFGELFREAAQETRRWNGRTGRTG